MRLSRCILLDGCTVRAHAVVVDSILGWRSTVGAWTRVEGVSVLGEDVHLGPEIFVNGALILPHKTISLHSPSPPFTPRHLPIRTQVRSSCRTRRSTPL